jgi:hypothetical protein
MTITSSSSRIIQSVVPIDAVAAVLLSLIKGHVQSQSDQGLICAVIACTCLHEALVMDTGFGGLTRVEVCCVFEVRTDIVCVYIYALVYV